MTKNLLGQYLNCSLGGEYYQAFVPAPLPPIPPINLTALQGLLAKANQALGKLYVITDILPDSNLLLYFYIRKEAVLSSQIEGTQSSLSDLLIYESNETLSIPIDDVSEVSSYIAALEHGQKRVREGFPLSLRLIREMHTILLSKGRGSKKQPGEFRTSQNWVGGTRPGNAVFVPPPADHLMTCLDKFEKYLHLEKRPYPSLIDAGLIHLQFETIHPFLDGNGRIGRLLITFFLMMMGDLKEPTLYLSLFFKKNRSAYYDHLTIVRKTGHWEEWLQFFLKGIIETANQAVETSQAVAELFKTDIAKIDTLKRASITGRRVHELLQQRAIIPSAKNAAKTLKVSIPTARTALNHLKQLGLVKDISGLGKERFYIYDNFIKLLEKGTEPLKY